MTPIETIVVPGTEKAPRASEADIVALLDGRVLLAWTDFCQGKGGDWDTARISAKISDDHGETWSERFTLIENEGDWNIIEPDFQRLPSGELLLYYLVTNSEIDARMVVRRSDDDGATWSDPTPISSDRGYHCTTNARSIRMASGRLVIPVGIRGTVYAYFSDDDGRTWTHGLPPLRGTKEPSASEPAVAELRNGDLLMYLRNGTGRIWQTLSHDGGETWSITTPTTLAASRSPVSLRRFGANGDLLVIWSQASKEEIDFGLVRTRLSCAISRDDGMTWECFNNLESLDDLTRVEPTPANVPEREKGTSPLIWQCPVVPKGYLNCSYPSCSVIGDRVYVTYDVSPPFTSLKLRVLPVEWFYGEHEWTATGGGIEDTSHIPSPHFDGSDKKGKN